MIRNLGVPVSCYLAITVLVPLLRGGWQRPAFLHHALVVCCAAALLCAVALCIRAVASPRRR